jgi:hypothetical protein
MATEDKHPHKCLSCGSVAIRRSHATLIDDLWSFAGYSVYRCRDCRVRFHLPAEEAPPWTKREARNESSKRRKALRRREVLVYAAAIVAFAIVAFIITRERG